MKATGIVRRIDDLGRVVIPKEIRRTMRIREGDPLEIFTDTDGEVVFKKYSPVGEMSPFAIQYADVMSRACSLPVLICDRDHVVAAAGVSKKEFTERRISAQLEEAMEQRQTHVAKAGDQKRLQPVESIDRYAGVMCPIVAAGDVTGAVCMLLPESGAVPTEGDVKLAQVAAAVLGKQREDYHRRPFRQLRKGRFSPPAAFPLFFIHRHQKPPTAETHKAAEQKAIWCRHRRHGILRYARATVKEAASQAVRIVFLWNSSFRGLTFVAGHAIVCLALCKAFL